MSPDYLEGLSQSDAASPLDYITGSMWCVSHTRAAAFVGKLASVMHYWKSQSLAEIAQHLGRTEAAVAGLLHRGLKQLRAKLRELE